jgi:homoserine kinase
VGIRYFGENGERVPRDRSNLAVRAMEAALHLKGREFTGADFEIYSSVPVAVGLGSSAAAVLGGLIAADRLFRLEFDEKTYFDLGAIYESRSDNLRAAWHGGFVVCAEEGGAFVHQRTVVPENLILSVVIPETPSVWAEREGGASRGAAKDSSAHLRRATTFAEFFARPGSEHALGPDTMPLQCEKVAPGMDEALRVEKPGLLTVFVCGSGPAIGVLTHGDNAEAVAAVQESFAQRGTATRTAAYRPTNTGASEWNAAHADITLPPSRGLGVLHPKSNQMPV